VKLLAEVRESCRALAHSARHVSVDADAAPSLDQAPPPSLDPERHYLEGDRASVASYLLTLAWRSPWPQMGLLVGSTPVLIYSTTVAAPNGLEMTSGAVVWAGLLALGQGAGDERTERRVIVVVSLAAVVLSTVRQLGPLWLLLTAVVCLGLFGPRRWASLLQRHMRASFIASVVVLAAVVGNIIYVRRSGTLAQGEVVVFDSPLGLSLAQGPAWILQSIAAFPIRNDPAPAIVYAIFLVVGAMWLMVGLQRGSSRERFAILASAGFTLAVPLAITLATVSTSGPVWQGRYTLPFSVGLLLLCALVMARRPPKHRLLGPVLLAYWLAVAAAHTVSIVDLQLDESRSPVATDPGNWPLLPAWVIAMLAIAGLAVWAAATGTQVTPATRSEVNLQPDDTSDVAS